MKKVLILYRELAGYVVACINRLHIEYQANVDVIAYPLNNDAPFQFQFAPGITLESRQNFTSESLLKKIQGGNYDLIFVSGWADKDYLHALKGSKTAVKIMGFDTWWYGTPKQQAAAFYARFFITPKFNYAFVPGAEQAMLAMRIGFDRNRVLKGVYACDVDHFSSIAEQRRNRSENSIKKLLFVGRYAGEKYIQELCETMIELQNEGLSSWQLHCIGTGPLFDTRIQHPCIVHHGFRQPAQLADLMRDGDAFILPSTFEPWGVVVHEFAAAGYPLLLSDKVGAKQDFLEDKRNGFVFEAGNRPQMKEAMKKIMLTPQNILAEMGDISSNLAKKITPDTWAKTLIQLM